MFFKQMFKIFFDNGTIVETDNLLSWIINSYPGGATAFYYHMKWLCKYKKQSFWGYYDYYNYNYDYNYSNFYLYTKNNMMISPELFKNEYKSFYYKSTQNSKSYKRKYLFAQWRKKHTTTYTRHMETLPCRREVAGVVKEEGEPEFRGKRRKLPDPWDEHVSRRSLSWKDCTKRKRQYKGS